MSIRVSVVIPTYNRAQDLPGALKSVIEQRFLDWELIVIDDASVDETPQVVNQMNDSRIRLIRLQENVGAARARNIGISQASGEFVAFLDSDDQWDPDYLDCQVRSMDENGRQAVLSYVGAWFKDAGTGQTRRRVPRHGGDISGAMLWTNVVGNCSRVMVRSAALEAAGGFDPDLVPSEDWDLWLRISRLGAVVPVKRILVRYLEHTGSLQANASGALRGREAFWAKHGVLDGDPARLAFHLTRFGHELAYRGHLAMGRRYAWRALRVRPTYPLAAAVGLGTLFGTRPYHTLAFLAGKIAPSLMDRLHPADDQT